MNLKIGKTNIFIEYLTICFVVLVIFFPSLRNYFENYVVCFSFIVFHEFAHIFAASMCGVECIKINVRLCGMNAVFKSQDSFSIKWLYIALAGPISNLLLAILFRKISIVKEINMALAIINLLPITPLDGYIVLKNILEFLLPKYKVKIVLKTLKILLLILIIFFGIYLVILFKNPAVLLFGIYVVILRYAAKPDNLKYVTKKLQKYYKFLLNLLQFGLKFSII